MLIFIIAMFIVGCFTTGLLLGYGAAALWAKLCEVAE